ncbi:YfhO family protein [Taibaiella lutea]|uniref:YfhO family protein n=1 Tax=Taibaiella lutea TaxID=2608001 RepID=A0A5M6CQ67_9BACT|nr:YfhO family protein [Taibaiella lutea]KAA5537458.1 YfhO family protein [Taibaiella lutea]
MQQQEGFKKFLPHLLIIGIFLALSCAFCYPQFQGKTLAQHDINTWLWASKESRDFHDKTGGTILWANNMFSGMPEISVNSYAENNWFRKLNMLFQLNDHGKTMPTPVPYFFMAMCCFYILMLTLRVNKWLGLIGAVAFAFSTYNPTIITAGHTSKFMDLAYIPVILSGMIWAYRGKYFPGAALAGLAFALFFDSNHLQIIYYSIFLFFIFVVAKFVDALRKKELKKWFFASVLIGIGAIFAFLASSSSIIQMKEFAPLSMRGKGSELTEGGKKKNAGLDKDYAFSWSNGVGECFSILVPNLYGGSIDENIGSNSNLGKKLSDLNQPEEVIDQMTSHVSLYWGPQPLLSGSVYFGAVICLLFVLSLFIIRSNMKWWLAGAALLFICFSMGKNFSTLNYFMFDHFPLFNSFRSPNMAISLASIIFPMLAIWALKDIFEEKISKEELWKKLKYSLIITGGLCLVILVATQTMMDYKSMGDERMIQAYGQAGPDIVKAIREDRQSAATTDAMRSLVFVLLAGGALWAYSKGKTNKNQTIIALGILIAIDLIPIAHRWLNEDKFRDTEEYMAENFEPSPADAQILQDKDPYYRVLDLTGDPFSNSKPSYFHKTLGGYSAAKLQIYQDLIENQLGKLNVPVLNMLNTKYFIIPTQDGKSGVQQNPAALGNAWFVSDIKWVKTADEEMAALNGPSLQTPMDTTAGNFNPTQTAIVRDTFKSVVGNYNFGKDPAAYIKLAPNGYAADNLKYESNNTQPGIAVFSDIYYPTGWTATIDGKEATVFKADYVLRAMKIPAGKHTIEFNFHSKAFETGKTMALIGSILLSLMIAAGIYFSFLQKRIRKLL